MYSVLKVLCDSNMFAAAYDALRFHGVTMKSGTIIINTHCRGGSSSPIQCYVHNLASGAGWRSCSAAGYGQCLGESSQAVENGARVKRVTVVQDSNVPRGRGTQGRVAPSIILCTGLPPPSPPPSPSHFADLRSHKEAQHVTCLQLCGNPESRKCVHVWSPVPLELIPGQQQCICQHGLLHITALLILAMAVLL